MLRIPVGSTRRREVLKSQIGHTVCLMLEESGQIRTADFTTKGQDADRFPLAGQVGWKAVTIGDECDGGSWRAFGGTRRRIGYHHEFGKPLLRLLPDDENGPAAVAAGFSERLDSMGLGPVVVGGPPVQAR